MAEMSRGLVVAKYKEDISWLKEVPEGIRVYIYDKSESGNLRNVGRDPGTFMHHIVEHYDELDDWTSFVQGWPFDHYSKQLLMRDIVNVEKDYWELGKVKFSVIGNGLRECGDLPLTALYKELMGKEVVTFEFVWGMQMILSKRLILRRPKSFYIMLRDKAEELYMEEWSLPMLERIWGSIWRELENEL